MKQITIIIAIILLANCVNAIELNLTYQCPNDQCIGGGPAKWNVSMSNGGQGEIEIQKIVLIVKRETLLGFYNITTTLYSKFNVIIEGELPYYYGTSEFNYSVCFITSVPIQQRVVDDVYLGLTRYHCDPHNFTMPIIQCIDNSTCLENEYCVNQTCAQIACTGCARIFNHLCLKHECCEQDDCKMNYACQKNKCRQLNCTQTQQILRHGCSNEDCLEDQFLFNNTCHELNCNEAEGYVNHSCIQLQCAKDQAVIDHKCTDYRCPLDEASINNTCIPLNCNENQIISNHTCTPIKCAFYSSADRGKCKFDTNFIFMGLEALPIAAIGLIVFLITQKMGKKK